MVGILIWIAVGLIGSTIHRLIDGPLDMSSYITGLFVTVIAIIIEEYQ